MLKEKERHEKQEAREKSKAEKEIISKAKKARWGH